jgi:hypothetical protein
MSALLRLLLAVALAAGMAGATTATALACTCANLTEEEAFAAADVVAVGVVVGRDDPFFGTPISNSVDPVRYTVAVEEVLKGDVGSQIKVTTARDGAGCGLELSIGQRWRLHAHRDDGLRVSLCGGSTFLSPDSGGPNHVPAGEPLSVFGLPWMLPGLILGSGAAIVAMALGFLGWF